MPIFSLSGIISQELTIGDETIELDGITEVSSTNSRTITTHPVEEGYNISDAQHQNPIQVTFRAWVTDTPQSVLDTKRMMASIANFSGLNIVEGHVKKQLQKLEAEANKGGLVEVRTKYALYSDFYCVSFSYTEGTAKGIELNISLMEKQDSADDERGTANFSSDLGLWS